jgi:hypothetical protein
MILTDPGQFSGKSKPRVEFFQRPYMFRPELDVVVGGIIIKMSNPVLF